MKRTQVFSRPEEPEKPGIYGKRGIITKKGHTFKKIPELSKKRLLLLEFGNLGNKRWEFARKYRIVVKRVVHLKRKGLIVPKDYSKYQQDVISRYYENLDVIMLGKLQELVTELYLADSRNKQDRLWDRAHKAMVKLKIKPAIVEHIMKIRSTTVLARNVADWLKSATGK